MDEQQYKALFSELKTIKEDIQATRDEVSRVDRDLGNDRVDFENFRVMLGGVIEEVKSLKRLSTNNVANMQDKVTDALKPAVQEVSSLKEEIKKKKTITFGKRSLGQWFKERFITKEVEKELKEVDKNDKK